MEEFIDTSNFSSYRVPLIEDGLNRHNRNHVSEEYNNHVNNEFSDGFGSAREGPSDINLHHTVDDDGTIHSLNKKHLFEKGT